MSKSKKSATAAPQMDDETFAAHIAEIASTSGETSREVLMQALKAASGVGITRIRELVKVEEARMRVALQEQAIADGQYIRDRNRDIDCERGCNMRLALAKMGVKLALNEFSGEITVEGVPGHGPTLTDRAADALWLLVEKREGFLPRKQTFDRVVDDVAWASRFHPVRDYLNDVAEKWDGVKRVESLFVDHAGTPDSNYAREVTKIWFTAGVARIFEPGCKFDHILVFEARQGKKKSLFLSVLAVRDEWFTDCLRLDASPKVVIEQTAGIWIAEFAELSGIRGRKDINDVKMQLTTRRDKARLSYGRRAETVPRQFVGAGSTNDREYLKDDENRRYWPLPITEFDVDAIVPIVDQIWAEAVALYRAGQKLYITDPKIEQAAREEQAARRDPSHFEEVLAVELGDREGWISSNAVWCVLGIDRPEEKHKQQTSMGMAMRALGFQRGRKSKPDEQEGLKIMGVYYWRGNDTNSISREMEDKALEQLEREAAQKAAQIFMRREAAGEPPF